MTSDGDVRWCLDQLKKYVGWQIVGTVEDVEANSYGLVVQHDPHGKPVEKRVLIWIDCDSEGNGPGFVYIEETEDDN